MACKEAILKGGPHLPTTHMAYFKLLLDELYTKLKTKDIRYGKAWEYVNCAGVWLEVRMTAMTLLKKGYHSFNHMGRLLNLTETSLKAALEILTMHEYLHNITVDGFEDCRQMDFLVEQGHDAIHFESYRNTRRTLP